MGRELIQFGHLCSLVLPQDLRPEILGAGFDVIINVNRPRSQYIPRGTIHVAWVQDYVYGTNLPYEENAQPNDIAYTFGDPLIQGLPKIWKHWRGSLPSAAEPWMLERKSRQQDVDLSLLGCTFPNIYEWMNPQLNEYMSAHAEEYYKPLSSSFVMSQRVHKIIDEMPEWVRQQEDSTSEIISWLFTHTRLVDRNAIAKLMLRVSDSVKLVGLEWNKYQEFEPYHVKHDEEVDFVLDWMQRSRINVHTNTSGYGTHSRVFEAMAVGAFIMAPQTPFVGKLGQMTECFEPDVHYGEYTAETFVDRALYWIAHPEQRIKAAMEAKRIVADRHLWRHRAEKLLKDIGRRNYVAGHANAVDGFSVVEFWGRANG
jgi:hypothetical protein